MLAARHGKRLVITVPETVWPVLNIGQCGSHYRAVATVDRLSVDGLETWQRVSSVNRHTVTIGAAS